MDNTFSIEQMFKYNRLCFNLKKKAAELNEPNIF